MHGTVFDNNCYRLIVDLKLGLMEKKQSRRFRHNSIIMPKRYERVRVDWHCAKVKGHAELKIEKPRVKTFSFPQITVIPPW